MSCEVQLTTPRLQPMVGWIADVLTRPRVVVDDIVSIADQFAAWLRGESRQLPLADSPMSSTVSTYPGGSKSRVSRAGNALRTGTATPEDLAVIDTWRAAHRPVLNTFQAILRIRARAGNIVVAQRHKRKRTIFDKLRRLPRMELARMDDIAGCRLIFESIEELRAFRAKVHAARFKHKRRNEVEKYDYITKPKETGYRGIHDIYEYDVNSDHGKDYKGLFVELQYRTFVQHAWATAVEVIGLITESQPKFQEGDDRYQQIMALASEILARAFESSSSSLPEMSNADLLQEFLALDGELHLLQILRGLNAADADISAKRNVILMFSEDDKLEIKTYRDATDALRALFELEKANPGRDVVLVRAGTTDEVRIAFRNYFSDAREFIRMVEEGCQILSGRGVTRVPQPVFERVSTRYGGDY
jgi:putative GTP pyrophosphokinase